MTSLSASDWNFFSTWNGQNLVATNTMGTPVWVKQAGGWVQGSLVYTQANGTTPFYTISSGGGTSMTWEVVDFLLQHLGFTVTAHPDYVTYSYRDLRNYAFSIPPRTTSSHWADMQLREILAYAYALIAKYEEGVRSADPPPPSRPLSEFEVEDW